MKASDKVDHAVGLQLYVDVGSRLNRSEEHVITVFYVAVVDLKHCESVSFYQYTFAHFRSHFEYLN